jgi:hypothetical protein
MSDKTNLTVREYHCACGSRENIVVHQRQAICGRCRDLQLAARAREARAKTVGQREKNGGTALWLYDEAKHAAFHFTASVSEAAGCLTIRGHGEYKLKVTP